MAGYLDTYGKSEVKREKIIKGLGIAAALLIIASGSLYFFMRDFQEKQKLNSFRELIAKKDYKAAYPMWGCTDSTPCPQYSFARFLRDWGPDSPVGKGSQVSVLRTNSCTDTVIQVWNIGAKEEVNLVVNRKDKVIGFAPWPVCDPHMKMP